jgi:hypothetical protein
MKKFIALAVVLSLTLAVAAVIPALGQDNSSRPDGVSMEEWMPISDNLGLVVVSQWPGADAGPTIGSRQALIATPPINGYFMVKRGTQWTRVVVLEPVRG